jgi:hypothetical protein
MPLTKSITALVIVGALGLAVVLNPSADRHRTKIKEAIAERSQLDKLLGVGEFTAFASKYHSLYLGSYTTAGDKVLSVGAFGMVFVSE